MLEVLVGILVLVEIIKLVHNINTAKDRTTKCTPADVVYDAIKDMKNVTVEDLKTMQTDIDEEIKKLKEQVDKEGSAFSPNLVEAMQNYMTDGK